MEFLKEWTFCVCVSLVIAVVLSLFSPQGRMQKFYKMLIALFVFVSFLYPLRNMNINDVLFEKRKEYSYAENNNGNGYEMLIERQISDVLTENKVVGASVSSSADYDAESGEITLHSVRIAVPDDYSITEVQSLVLNTLGIHAEVVHIGD